MKSNQKLIVLILLFFFSIQAKSQIIDVSPFLIDTNQFRIDSVLNSVKIQDYTYTIILIRDRYTEQMIPFETNILSTKEFKPEQSPITLLIVDKLSGKIKFQKKIGNEFNDYPFQNWKLIKGPEKSLNHPGKLFLSIDKSYGGSGSINTTYLIDISEIGITVLKIFSSAGELSDFMITKNDKELFLISGIWNPQEKEAHFSDHRFQLKKFTFNKGQVQAFNLGITNLKYPPIDEENSCETIIHQIRSREKAFTKTLPED